ncbi:MAG: TVP38/TMEM64 family protein [Magnetococcales bacterium]|nr:TVP38/TMEM64 family protein [Magnetococcales bacterium]
MLRSSDPVLPLPLAIRPLLLLVAVGIVLFFYGDWAQYLTLEGLKASYRTLEALRAASPWQVASLFFALYVGITALSIPGHTFLMLAGGALFGWGLGTVLVSFAASLGATLAFLLARYLLRDAVQNRFGDHLGRINRGLAEGGICYLLTVRLLPLFPSFLVNWLMGLTTMPTRTFYWVSQLGLLLPTLIYVQAGTQLARIQQPADILSVELLCTFLLLAALPLLVRQVLRKKPQGRRA